MKRKSKQCRPKTNKSACVRACVRACMNTCVYVRVNEGSAEKTERLFVCVRVLEGTFIRTKKRSERETLSTVVTFIANTPY
jgi:hypothetical protein